MNTKLKRLEEYLRIIMVNSDTTVRKVARPAVKTITEFSEGQLQDIPKIVSFKKLKAAEKARHNRWHVKRNLLKEGCDFCEGRDPFLPKKLVRPQKIETPVITTQVVPEVWKEVKQYINSYPEAKLRPQILSTNEVIVWNH